MALQMVAGSVVLSDLQTAVHWAPLMVAHLADLRAGPSAALKADWTVVLMADLMVG